MKRSVARTKLSVMSTTSVNGIPRLAGIATVAELGARGVSRGQIRTAVLRGELVSMGIGVYATASVVEELRRVSGGDQVLRVTAALATVGAGAVASHQTAAAIHGLDLVGIPPQWVTITRPQGNGSRSGKPGVLVHCAALPAEHTTERVGVAVTTVARTVVDLARTLDMKHGVVAADSALRTRQTSDQELRSVLQACRGWRGALRAADVVEFADWRSESALESIARVVIRDCGLPRPELQVPIRCDGVTYRVDFLWSHYRTIAEVDGAAKYDGKPLALYQLRRDAQLREAGYEVVHFDWEEITTDPLRVAESVRAAFGRAKRLGRVAD
jgi:very-short-patch-repair endonuclease/predicted transcriptional regulator of viral defense system